MTGGQPARFTPRSPNLNALQNGSFFLLVPRECLNHVVPPGERHLRRLLNEYLAQHYQVLRRSPRALTRPPGTGDGDAFGAVHRGSET